MHPDWKSLITVFAAIFIAELGDKTQVATLLFASNQQADRWMVFLGASLALICTSAIGVLAGDAVSNFLSPNQIRWIAGFGFIVIGVWMLVRG